MEETQVRVRGGTAVLCVGLAFVPVSVAAEETGDSRLRARRLAFRSAMAEGKRAEEDRRTLGTAEEKYRLASSQATGFKERAEAGRASSRIRKLKEVDALLNDGQRALDRGDFAEAVSKFTEAWRKMRYISRAPRWVTAGVSGVRAKIDGAKKALADRIAAETKRKMELRRRAGFRTLALHVAVCAKRPALTLAFIATNIGRQDLALPPILSGRSCLELVKPDGSRRKLFLPGEGEGAAAVIEPTGTRTWHVQLARLETLTRFDLPGAYLLRWIVAQGGDAAPVTSSELLLVKRSDEMEGKRRGDAHYGFVARDVRWSSSDAERGGPVALKIGAWIEKAPALAFVARNAGDTDFAMAPLDLGESRAVAITPGGERVQFGVETRFAPVVIHPSEARIWRRDPQFYAVVTRTSVIAGQAETGLYGVVWQITRWHPEQRKLVAVAESNELLVLVEGDVAQAGDDAGARSTGPAPGARAQASGEDGK